MHDPGGILSTASNINEKDRQLVKDSWQNAHGGANQGSTALLWGDWKYAPVGLSNEDAQFLQTRQFSRAEIATIFRIPPHIVGDLSRLSNSNHENQQLQFVTGTLRPYLTRLEQEVHRKLMPSVGRNSGRYFVQFDIREMLRGDFASTLRAADTCKAPLANLY